MLSDQISNYLALRRAVGFKLNTVETYLRSFGNFASARGDTHVFGNTVIDWAAQARSANSRARRLEVATRFARFVHAEDTRHEIPPNHVFCKRIHRRAPYLMSDNEMERMMIEAGSLNPKDSLRPHTYRTIFGLLASTGLRISEALRLQFDDVTPDGLIIRETKFKKTRLVPLHETVDRALGLYLERRRHSAGIEPHLFVSHRTGRRLHYAVVARTFREVLATAGIPDQRSSAKLRLHDLRHRFAVAALQSGPNERDRIADHMLALSTYMGHARVESTYWYLESTPALMTDISGVCEGYFEGLST